MGHSLAGSGNMRTCGISWNLAAILALAFFSEAMSLPMIPGYSDLSQLLHSANAYQVAAPAPAGSRKFGESCGEYVIKSGGSTSKEDDGDCGSGLECHFDPADTDAADDKIKPGTCKLTNGATCMQDDNCKSGKCAKSVSNYA